MTVLNCSSPCIFRRKIFLRFLGPNFAPSSFMGRSMLTFYVFSSTLPLTGLTSAYLGPSRFPPNFIWAIAVNFCPVPIWALANLAIMLIYAHVNLNFTLTTLANFMPTFYALLSENFARNFSCVLGSNSSPFTRLYSTLQSFALNEGSPTCSFCDTF